MLNRLVCVVALFAVLFATAAMSVPGHCRETYDMWAAVIEEFELEETDVIPHGVTPAVARTPQQLRSLLSGSRRVSHESVNSFSADSFQDTGHNSADSLEAGILSLSLEETDSSQWPIALHLYADLFLMQSLPFFMWQIACCDDEARFTGASLLSEYGGEWSCHSISSDKQRVEIEGGGWIKHYIYIWPIGEVHVMTDHRTIEMEFAL